MAKRLYTTYSTLRQSDHDLPTGLYDENTFNFGWEVEIHDRDFVGVASEIGNLGREGVVLKMNGGRNNMNKVIVPTIASFSILVDSQAEEDFLTDLSLGDEERFFIKVYHRQELKFTGYTIVDQITEDITESNRILNVTAVDGLSRMKEIKYPLQDWDDVDDQALFQVFGYPTFLEVISRCMTECNIPNLYDSDWPLYNVYINWYESRMSTTDVTKPSECKKLIKINCNFN